MTNTKPENEEVEVPDHAPSSGEPYQKRVLEWMMACFSMEICRDRQERNHRFLEEALELVQSLGCIASEAHQLVDYTFGRDIGEPEQKLGGVMVTLAALCFPNDLNMDQAAEKELARVWTKIEKIRAKQAVKPKHSPLPEVTQSAAISDDLAPSIRTAESMLSAHIEEFHDFDYQPHEVPSELQQLRDIQHHLLGSLIDKDGEIYPYPDDVAPSRATASTVEADNECPKCVGTGTEESYNAFHIDGGFQTCRTCNGSGEKAATPPSSGNADAVRALEPFAELADHLVEKHRDSRPIIYALDTAKLVNLTVGDLRRAKAALSSALVAGEWKEALAKGFMTACSGDGEYQIKIGFETLKDMQAAHMALCKSAYAHPRNDRGGHANG